LKRRGPEAFDFANDGERPDLQAVVFLELALLDDLVGVVVDALLLDPPDVGEP
jgi:hypothetical protein